MEKKFRYITENNVFFGTCLFKSLIFEVKCFSNLRIGVQGTLGTQGTRSIQGTRDIFFLKKK